MVYMYVQGFFWFILCEFSERGQRLILLTDDDEPGPLQNQVWDHAFETDWNIASANDFKCEVNRGDLGNDLFILNHFVSNPLPNLDTAIQVNEFEFLASRIAQCESELGRSPNFVTVDFYGQGDVFDAVASLNQE